MIENEILDIQTISVKFKPLIKKQISRLQMEYTSISLDKEDLYNLILFDIHKSLEGFDWSKKEVLPAYLKSVVRNCGINHCKSFTTTKHRVSNFAKQYNDSETGGNINDVDRLEETRNIIRYIAKSGIKFTVAEEKILYLFTDGKNVREAALILNKDERAITRCKSNIKTKIKNAKHLGNILDLT